MKRRVSSSLSATVQSPARVELQVAVADGVEREERLTVTLDGVEVTPVELATPVGGRLHVVDVPAGQLRVRYDAEVDGRAAPARAEPLDESTYLRPSRYAESDRLAGFAAAELGAVDDPARLLRAAAAWVGQHLSYVPGSSTPTDGATDTLLARSGVCRDYAHLAVAMLRARDVPARLVSVYAPGLSPMDFHAVVEALVDGVWQVADATLLAPRTGLVRIATGRDAADTAFLSNYGGTLVLDAVEVTATCRPDLPDDDLDRPASLG